MKVIGISGSARKDGNTAQMRFEAELIRFAGQVIEPCKACWACGEKTTAFIRKICCK